MSHNIFVASHITNKKIAFITSKDLPDGTEDDLAVKAPLEALGYDLVPVIWDETSLIELNRFAAIVIRSPWDYQHKKEKFETFVKSLENLHQPVLNCPSLMLWNIDKSYLFELQDKGIDIVPSRKIPKNQDSVFWRSLIENLPWDNLVLKPTVSASAYNTFQILKPDAIKRVTQWEGLSAKSDFLVQEFCPSIQIEGEASLIFFNDGIKAFYSHAILKKPKSEEFRVQTYFGGTVENYFPEDQAIHFAELVLSKIEFKWLFARVDILRHKGQWVLGELEVLEPQLFLPFSKDAPENFARAIEAHIIKEST